MAGPGSFPDRFTTAASRSISTTTAPAPETIPTIGKQLQTVVIDPDGVEITGYIFADNYYELYVNGRYVARDRLAMTPFNSTIVRFRASYPMTYAIKAIDWETRHGVGMEYQSFNIGDGGFIAYFSDGNRTSADWRAETFYIAPLDDPLCVRTAAAATRRSARRRSVRSVPRKIRPAAARCISKSLRTGPRRGSMTAHGRPRWCGGRSK